MLRFAFVMGSVAPAFSDIVRVATGVVVAAITILLFRSLRPRGKDDRRDDDRREGERREDDA